MLMVKLRMLLLLVLLVSVFGRNIAERNQYSEMFTLPEDPTLDVRQLNMLTDAGEEIEHKIIEPVYEAVAEFAHSDPLDFDIIVGVLLAVIILTVCFFCCWWAHRRSESYGLFRDDELSKTEKIKLRLFKIDIPEVHKDKIKITKAGIGVPSEICFLHYRDENDFKFLKTSAPLPLCTKYKYFEVEVLENDQKAEIVIGLVPESSFDPVNPPIRAKHSYLLYGSNGVVHVNGKRWGETEARIQTYCQSGGLLQQKEKKRDGIKVFPISNGIVCPKLTNAKKKLMEKSESEQAIQTEEEKIIKAYEHLQEEGKSNPSLQAQYEKVIEDR